MSSDTAKTHVLELTDVDTASRAAPFYVERVGDDATENGNSDLLDSFAGHLTASHCSTFRLSGTVSTLLASDIGSEFAGHPRVITSVKAWASVSGSGGVTRVNVLRQQDGVDGALVSIYSNNAFKPAVSGGASHASYKVFSGGTISGSLWKAGTVLVVRCETAADLMSDLTVQVNWKPSGAYNF